MVSASSASVAANKGKAPAISASEENLRIVRETIESVVIAFILAFLFKTFAAEMFVIPTGSMAPTLQGRHKDLKCPQCGFRYRTSASAEVNTETNVPIPGMEVKQTICPMCRFRCPVLLEEPNGMTRDNPSGNFRSPLDWKGNSYNGDRIVVAKFIYDISDPKRWDVVVFKYPEGAKINYIKRLVGLPNETVKIIDGDIYVKADGEKDFHIARKPPGKVHAMLQDVYDNDYVLDPLIEHGWPERWRPWTPGDAAGSWKHPLNAEQKPNRKVYELDGKATGQQWLRFVNTPPDENVCNRVWDEQNKTWLNGTASGSEIEKATGPVRDFCAYNANEDERGSNDVTDLAVECQARIDAAQGSMTLELVKKGHRCQCRFDLKSGDAALSVSGLPDYALTAKAALTPGEHKLLLANVDSQLLLWVDDKLIEFTGGGENGSGYPPFTSEQVVALVPVVGSESVTDDAPAGIAVDGVAARVEHLRILRDVFYTPGERMRWYSERNEANVGPNKFWMLGDNSPQSSDGRVWGTVDRNLLTGKALFIYWPHSFDHTSADGGMWFPFFPNFGRMGRVR